MLEGQEYSLLEPSGRHNITHTIVSIQESLLFAEGKPHHESSLFAISLITLTDHMQERLLSLSEQDRVSPFANIHA
jgi:hypothetical protein